MKNRLTFDGENEASLGVWEGESLELKWQFIYSSEFKTEGIDPVLLFRFINLPRLSLSQRKA